MNLLLHTVQQEKQRIDYMIEQYQTQLAVLPKGTLSEKAIGEKRYYYLKFRDGKKVISQYITKSDVDAVRKQIDKRKHLEAMLKSLQEEKAIADRVLEGIV